MMAYTHRPVTDCHTQYGIGGPEIGRVKTAHEKRKFRRSSFRPSAMSSAYYARQLFRSCSTSLSSRTLARPSTHATLSRSGISNLRRDYSETKSPEQVEEQKTDEPIPEGEKVEKEEQALSPEAEKLKAKEAEVVDLTVRTVATWVLCFLS